MLLILPIRTESTIRRPPHANYALIALNVVVFLLFNDSLAGKPLVAFPRELLTFQTDEPSFYQFLSYQFLHADFWHLFGNMLFLWVFGNAVNAKMGNLPYLLFYLAGGIFAAWGFALVTPQPSQLLGASGAIAAVTTAYLALFPRSRITVLLWFFVIIHFVEIPAMIIIGLKIIVWDNVITPVLGRQDSVANSAHLAGYLFGFVCSLGLLWIRALPRDHFDILALWKRWHQRRELAAVMSVPGATARARFGSAARVNPSDSAQRAVEERLLDQTASLRSRISELLDHSDLTAASTAYEELAALDPKQCLSQRQQLEIAREFYNSGRASQAAAAFERFVECYPNAPEAGDMRLLLGIIYARDLQQFEVAKKYLTQSMETLCDRARLDQCAQWLQRVSEALQRSVVEP